MTIFNLHARCISKSVNRIIFVVGGVTLNDELCPIYQGCRELTFALARLSCISIGLLRLSRIGPHAISVPVNLTKARVGVMRMGHLPVALRLCDIGADF